MTSAVETQDHDEGLAALHVGEVAHLVQVLLAGHRWAMVSPGDPVAELLVDIEPA